MSSIELPVISPRERRPAGCCVAAVEPDLGQRDAVELASTIKALADPTRLRIVDALRKAAPEAICQCELTPLFDEDRAGDGDHVDLANAAASTNSLPCGSGQPVTRCGAN